MNATTATSGAFRPTAMTTKVRVAARLYAGAVEATPITTLETRPSAPPFRPLSSYCSMGCADAVVAMPHPPGFDPRDRDRDRALGPARSGGLVATDLRDRCAGGVNTPT